MAVVDGRPPVSVAGVEASEVASRLGVDVAVGLSQAEAASRLQSNGPNKLAGGKKESGFQAFLRQYQDFMQIVLLVAAVVNLIVTGELGTSVVLAGLTLFNAVIGLRQEAKAEESVKALAQMMKTITRVRRGRPGDRDRRRGARGRRRRARRGRQQGARRRPDLRRGHARDRGSRTHRREPPGRQVDRPCPRRRRTARRPDLRGVHEHRRHAGPRRADRHRHGHGHRDRPHRRPVGEHHDRQDPAAEAAGRPVQDHRRHRGRRPCLRGGARSGTRRVLRHPVHHRCGPGGRRDPDRPASRRHGPAVDGHPRDRQPQRDREAAPGRRDTRLDLGDLFGQDRHPDAEQDDGTGDGDPRPEPLTRSRARATARPERSSTSAGPTSTSTPTCSR